MPPSQGKDLILIILVDYMGECFLHQPAIYVVKLILEFSKYVTIHCAGYTMLVALENKETSLIPRYLGFSRLAQLAFMGCLPSPTAPDFALENGYPMESNHVVLMGMTLTPAPE